MRQSARWRQALRRGTVSAALQEKRQECARLWRTVGGGEASWLDLQLPGRADAVAAGEGIAGESVPQISAELRFRSKDQRTHGGMHAVSANQQIKRLGHTIVEGHFHRLWPWFCGDELSPKAHLHLTCQRVIGVMGRYRSVHNPNAPPICGEVSVSAPATLDAPTPVE